MLSPFSNFCDTFWKYVACDDMSASHEAYASSQESVQPTRRERTRTGQRARCYCPAVSSPIISRMIFSPASIGSISVLIPVIIYPGCFFRNSSERSFASFAASAL